MNDFWMESFLALTGTEQFSLIYSIKWLIVSECMLFFACFWSLINFRVISTGFSLFFSFPLFFGYSFGIPFSNLLILLFSGLPIQAAQLFLKIGFLINTIEGVAQCLSCGWLFIILQLKEFLYSYFSLSDVMIGSIFYFTTGLHGFHVLFGSFGFFLTLSLIIFSSFPFSISAFSFNLSFNFIGSFCFISSLFYLLSFPYSSLLSILINSCSCGGRFSLNPSFNIHFYSILSFFLLLAGLFINLSFSFLSLFYSLSSLFYFPVLLKELSMSFFLVSFYWHFVDWIWFLVFLFFLLA